MGAATIDILKSAVERSRFPVDYSVILDLKERSDSPNVRVLVCCPRVPNADEKRVIDAYLDSYPSYVEHRVVHNVPTVYTFSIEDDNSVDVTAPIGPVWNNGRRHSREFIGACKAHFEFLWRGGGSADSLTNVVYDNIFGGGSSIVETDSLVLVRERFDDLVTVLAAAPQKVRDLSSRQFEHLVCDLFQKEGHETTLTPATRDGGRDIIVRAETAVGKQLFYVECKHYSFDNPVNVTIARAFYGTVEQARATAGLIVTTSRFTEDAMLFCKPIEHRMSLRDYDQLAAWIQRVAETKR